MPQLLAKIPRERIAILIGSNGASKQHIEKKLAVMLEISSETGDITISLKENANDPSLLFKARDIVLAIGRGFSPERAFQLLEDEEAVLEIIDLREIFGRSDSDIKRVNGRIIGREGKTRRIIEEMTDASISVFGHTIAIIGNVDEVEIARQAIKLLIQGSQHATVYKYLQKMRRELKKKQLQLWEGSELFSGET